MFYNTQILTISSHVNSIVCQVPRIGKGSSVHVRQVQRTLVNVLLLCNLHCVPQISQFYGNSRIL